MFKTVLSQLFFMFSVIGSSMENNKAIENRTPVYLQTNMQLLCESTEKELVFFFCKN